MLRKQLDKKKLVAEALKRSGTDDSKVGGVIVASGDVHRTPGQNFLVLSYVLPDGGTKVKSLKNILFKFSGCRETEAQAREYAKVIRDENPLFDVFVVDTGKWGVCPLPQEERQFLDVQYVNPLLTRSMSRIHDTMAQSKKEMDDRKARDRAKAEALMRKTKGPDYVMPEKSAELQSIEDELRKKRDDEEAAALNESRESEITYTYSQISDLTMQWCLDNNQDAVGIGASLVRYIAEKMLERQAEMVRSMKSMARGGSFDVQPPKEGQGAPHDGECQEKPTACQEAPQAEEKKV